MSTCIRARIGERILTHFVEARYREMMEMLEHKRALKVSVNVAKEFSEIGGVIIAYSFMKIP